MNGRNPDHQRVGAPKVLGMLAAALLIAVVFGGGCGGDSPGEPTPNTAAGLSSRGWTKFTSGDLAGAQSDPLAAVLYAGFDHRVDYTIVNGEVVVEKGRLVNGNEREIAREATELSFRMLEAAGVETPWPLRPPDAD